MKIGLFALALGVLTVGIYSPSLSAGFVYEDAAFHDACLANPANIHTNWRSVPRTLALQSWCWQKALGHGPGIFHAVNIAGHLIVVALIFSLVRALGVSMVGAGIAAAVFAVHPLGVESVAYLAGRGELIAAIGVLGACLAAVSGWWISAVTLTLFGLMGKESAIVVVALVPLCLAVRTDGRRSAVLAGVATLAALTIYGGSAMQLLSSWSASWQWALLQATATIRLMGLSMAPIGQTVDYDYALVPMIGRLSALGAVIGFGVSAWIYRDHYRMASVGVAWMLISVLPRFVIPTAGSVLNEHQFYTPLIGLAMIASGFAPERS